MRPGTWGAGASNRPTPAGSRSPRRTPGAAPAIEPALATEALRLAERADRMWPERNWGRFVRNALDAGDRAGLWSHLTGLRALVG